MTDFYTKLKAGVPRSAALRQVQLQMLRSGTRKHPYSLGELHPVRAPTVRSRFSDARAAPAAPDARLRPKGRFRAAAMRARVRGPGQRGRQSPTCFPCRSWRIGVTPPAMTLRPSRI